MTEDVKDCDKKIAAGGDANLVYPAMAKDDYTVSYSKNPISIPNVGDKTVLQQSYFIGAAIKFFKDTSPDTEAGYYLVGNYPDIDNKLKYGKLEYYPNGPRDLFG